ncbi:MAG: type II secretion system F family protein [Clostridia bacterium]|nr:type II secretion system F family protein [Clostridia bacterium]MDD4375886.1 type II secretion system F family protein [Clostridia bacterium]
MPDYKYKAVLKNGKIIRNIISAKNRSEVIQKIKATKMMPISVTAKKITQPKKSKKKVNYDKLAKIGISKNERGKKNKLNIPDVKGSKVTSLLTAEVGLPGIIKPKDVLTFTNNLYILKKAKFNNITALESVYNSSENKKLREIIEEMIIGVDSGETINNVMSRYPKVFPPLYTNFVRVGEESGSLDVALEYGRDYMESNIKLRKTLRGILIPKILQFVLIMVVMMVTLLFGAPMIENVYEMFDSDKELPKLTQVAIEMSKWIISNWYIVLAIIALMYVLFRVLISSPRGRYRWDKFKVKFPVFGKLNLNIVTSKFFQAMLLNIKNGMRIQESLEVSKHVTTNYYILALIETGKNNLLSGGSWIEPFAIEGAFSPMIIEMLEIGMQTDLTEMMVKIEEYLGQEINESIARTIKLLPEIMYIFIGIVLVFFVITVMTPLIDVYMGGFLFDSI